MRASETSASSALRHSRTPVLHGQKRRRRDRCSRPEESGTPEPKHDCLAFRQQRDRSVCFSSASGSRGPAGGRSPSEPELSRPVSGIVTCASGARAAPRARIASLSNLGKQAGQMIASSALQSAPFGSSGGSGARAAGPGIGRAVHGSSSRAVAMSNSASCSARTWPIRAGSCTERQVAMPTGQEPAAAIADWREPSTSVNTGSLTQATRVLARARAEFPIGTGA
jgi:hypothetical protein